MNVLAIGAHPDDLEIGCAGTLIRHVQEGDEVFMAIATDGSMGGEPEVRRREQLDAAKIVGARDVFFLDYADASFECNRESIMRLEQVIMQVDPDVGVHWPKVGENLESLMLFRGL